MTDERPPCTCPDDTGPWDPDWNGEVPTDPDCPYHGTRQRRGPRSTRPRGPLPSNTGQDSPTSHDEDTPMPTADDSHPLDQVTSAAVCVENVTRQLDQARAVRDEAVAAALAAGYGPTEIARAAGLTRRAVYDIKERT